MKVATFRNIEHSSIGNIHNLDVDDECMHEEPIEKYLTKPEDGVLSPMVSNTVKIGHLG